MSGVDALLARLPHAAVVAYDEGELRATEHSGGLGFVVGVKDAYATRVPQARFGSAAAPPITGEAAAVTALRAAGATLGVKTRCSEACIGEYQGGAPRSPLDRSRIAGASSGGCALAVAEGLVRASLATDTGGSIRSPAAYCGVVGIKPSFGLMPLDGAIPLAPSLDHGGVLAESVATGRQVIEAVIGAPLPTRSRGVVLVAGAEHPELQGALRRVADAVDAEPAPLALFAGWRDAFSVLMPAEAAHAQSALREDPATGAAVLAIHAIGLAFSEDELAQARARRDELTARVDAALAEDRVLIGPAVDGLPPTTMSPRGSEAFWAEMDHLAPLNLSGHPAVVVPIAGGVPLALQVSGPRGADGLVVDVAAEVEHILAAGDQPR